jgi:catechol 2,3-dioxygenase-like lactoylglutathione lyase family enzyme
MKRFHVHVAVRELEQSTRFYSALFGVAPTVRHPDYAKWMLDDPRLNFAISTRAADGTEMGVNHLGFQAETDEELEEIHTRLRSADTGITAEKGVNCCYARSDKYWVRDPAGIAWESFRSLDTIPVYGEPSRHEPAIAAIPSIPAAAEPAGAGCGTACCPAPAKTDAQAAPSGACSHG